MTKKTPASQPPIMQVLDSPRHLVGADSCPGAAGKLRGQTKALANWREPLLPGVGTSPRPSYRAVPSVMPLHSLLMGITSFAPERHIRMYANTIPENPDAVKGLMVLFMAVTTWQHEAMLRITLLVVTMQLRGTISARKLA